MRELANHKGRASDSGRLVTLARRLSPRCNRDGKAFRERDGVRLKVGGMVYPCLICLDQILTAGGGDRRDRGASKQTYPGLGE